MTHTDPKIIVALDFATMDEALSFAQTITPEKCRLKIGKELFTVAGPELVRALQKDGFEIFLDLKFHDIPATVARACAAAAELGVWMVNVHAMGGMKMMQQASEAVAHSATKIIAVTVLTSMDQNDLKQLGFQDSVEQRVKKLAVMARDAGMDGVVCSAQEVVSLRQELESDFLLVTPGIRPSWAASNDQKRIVTPCDAIGYGANYLVIGRPITRADRPIEALEKIVKELESC